MTNDDADLAALIEEATVDAYGEAEQLGGFHALPDEARSRSISSSGGFHAYREWTAGGLS